MEDPMLYNPKRSLEQQRQRLIEAEMGQFQPKKPLATRGSAALLGQKHKISSNAIRKSHVQTKHIFISMTLAFASFLGCFVFFDLFQSIIASIFVGFIVFFTLVKPFNQAVSPGFIIQEQLSFEELLENHQHLLDENCSVLLNQIRKKLDYLLPLTEESFFSLQQIHFITSCKEKYIPDILAILAKAPEDKLAQPQVLCAQQFTKLNNHLQNIIEEKLEDINTAIKAKGSFSPD